MQLKDDKDRISEFANNYRGEMFSRGLDSAVTGIGGNANGGIIIDDGNNPVKSESERVRSEELRKFRDYSIGRKSDPKKTSTIIIQQRVHVSDISGYVLKEFPEKYEYVKIATRAKTDEEWRSPKYGNVLAIRKPGDLLHAERFGDEEDTEALRSLGAYMYAARHAQEPYPSSGGIFGTGWWRYFDDLPRKYTAAISVDASFGSLTDTASFVVIQCWLISRPNFYVHDQFRRRMTFPETKKEITRLYAYWQQELGCSIAPILVEAKANGKAIIQSLRSSIPGIVEILPTESKISRAQAVSPIYEGGNVLLRRAVSWLDEYKIEFEGFPNYSSDDCVDASSQIIQYYLKKWRSQDAANDDEYRTTKVKKF
jgi:predicted phage terminase large subunit-like protein